MQIWLDDEEREGVATYAISRAHMEYAGPINPWDMARLLGVRIETLRTPGIEGQCCDDPPTIWIRERGSQRTRAFRLAHELSHLSAIWCHAPSPHCERSIDDIAARILVPSRWISAMIRRGLVREKIVDACRLVERPVVARRIREVVLAE